MSHMLPTTKLPSTRGEERPQPCLSFKNGQWLGGGGESGEWGDGVGCLRESVRLSDAGRLPHAQCAHSCAHMRGADDHRVLVFV